MRLPRVVMWQRIAEILTAEISAGHFPPASRLPTETALAERFGVNRHTLRQAIGALSDAGLVSVQARPRHLRAPGTGHRISAGRAHPLQ